MSALSRASLSVSSSIDFSLSSIEVPVFLKSKRVATSRARLVDRVADLLHVELGDDVERRHACSYSSLTASRDTRLAAVRSWRATRFARRRFPAHE